jgi:ferredoxin
VRAAIDQDRCAGHGLCVVTCPTIFGLTKEGYAETIEGEIPTEIAELVQRAVGECPERAITVDSD